VLAGAGHFTAGKEDICDPALAQRSPSRRCLGKRGVIAVQEMVTKDYPPWHGDSLSNLAIVREPHSIGVQSIEDSPEVRLILSRYASPQVSSTPAIQGMTAQAMKDPSQELVRDLEGYPHFEVTAGTHCKILARTEVRCRGNTYTSTFVKVRISSGIDRSKEGLVCDADIVRTVAFR